MDDAEPVPTHPSIDSAALHAHATLTRPELQDEGATGLPLRSIAANAAPPPSGGTSKRSSAGGVRAEAGAWNVGCGEGWAKRGAHKRTARTNDAQGGDVVGVGARDECGAARVEVCGGVKGASTAVGVGAGSATMGGAALAVQPRVGGGATSQSVGGCVGVAGGVGAEGVTSKPAGAATTTGGGVGAGHGTVESTAKAGMAGAAGETAVGKPPPAPAITTNPPHKLLIAPHSVTAVPAPVRTVCRLGALSSTSLSREEMEMLIESAEDPEQLEDLDVDNVNPPPSIGRLRLISWPGYTIDWTGGSTAKTPGISLYARVENRDSFIITRKATRDTDGAKHFLKVGASVKEADAIFAEGELLRELALKSPCILPVIDVVRCMWYGTPAAAIIMPLADRWPSGYPCDSRGVLRTPFPARVALRSLRRVAQALAYMHSQGAAHRDVKPWNVLYLEDEAYLADVGLSMRRPWKKPEGTRVYMAPEVRKIAAAVRKEENEERERREAEERARGLSETPPGPRAVDVEYDAPAADMWSLGITYVEWRSGGRPVQLGTKEDFIRSVQYRLGMLSEVPRVKGCSPLVYPDLNDKSQARDRCRADVRVVGALLQMDPQRRMSAARVVEMVDSELASLSES